VMHLDEAQCLEILLEFLEVFVHQVLTVRKLYSADVFERQRLYGIAVKRARHPELVNYIRETILSLKVLTIITPVTVHPLS